MASESENISDDAGSDVLSQSLDDVVGASDDGSESEGDDETNVDIGVDVIYDDEEASDNGTNTSHHLKSSNHQINLDDYATSNPILLALLVILAVISIPLKRQK